MARKSNSFVLALTLGIVFLVLLVFVSAIAGNSSSFDMQPLVTLPIWLKFGASLVGAAVAISVLILFTLRVWGSRDAGFAELGIWMIAFLAALTLWESHWATVLALTLLTVTHLVIAFFAQRHHPLPPAEPRPPGDSI